MHVNSLLMTAEPPKMSPRSQLLALPLEIRVEIYRLVFFRKCLPRGNGPSRPAVKHWLWNVDTALLFVNRQIHKESLGYVFSVNTFVLPPTLVVEYTPALLAQAHNIKSVMASEATLREINQKIRRFMSEQEVRNYIPKNVRNRYVSIMVYRYPSEEKEAITLEALEERRGCYKTLFRLKQHTSLRIRFLRQGRSIETLDAALEANFPGSLMSLEEERLIFAE